MPKGRLEKLLGATIGRYLITQDRIDDNFIYLKGEPHAKNN